MMTGEALAGELGMGDRSGGLGWAARVTEPFSRNSETVRSDDEPATRAALETTAPSAGGESFIACWVPDPRGVAAAPSGPGRWEAAGLGGVVAIVVGAAAGD